MRYLLLALCLMLGACSGVAVLEPAHEMAVENQQNLDANIETLIEHFLRIARSHPDYELGDEAALLDLTDTIREQAAISMAYIALIDAYIQGKDLDAEAFGNLLSDLPRLIEEGVDLWKEFQKLFGGEE